MQEVRVPADNTIKGLLDTLGVALSRRALAGDPGSFALQLKRRVEALRKTICSERGNISAEEAGRLPALTPLGNKSAMLHEELRSWLGLE